MKHEDRDNVTKTGETLLPLVEEIRELVQSARKAASQNINTLQVATNFEIGRRIVEYEQQGSKRAEYGKRTLIELSHRLTEELGRGFSATNLEYMRRFYLDYHETIQQIPQTVSGKLLAKTPMETPIPQTRSAQSPVKLPVETPIRQTLSAQFTSRFTISWSHYIFLMNIDNLNERRFYEIES
jgi:predicted nuclease of restriction endonuclease-like (RecB) superfamily